VGGLVAKPPTHPLPTANTTKSLSFLSEVRNLFKINRTVVIFLVYRIHQITILCLINNRGFAISSKKNNSFLFF
jgi:hypothetical protein